MKKRELEARRTAARHKVTIWLFIAIGGLFVLPVQQAQARVDYQECVYGCRQQFRTVVESETSCLSTIKDVRHDLKLVRDLLAPANVCRGRSRTACLKFRERAQDSLTQLINLTYNVQDCRDLDVAAIRQHLWLFDPVTACRGDGLYTDLHDLLATNGAMIRKLNNSGTVYRFLTQSTQTLASTPQHLPRCGAGQRPLRRYLWPLLQFQQAFQSLEPQQQCLSQCRKPTPAEVHLWETAEQLPQLDKDLAAQAQLIQDAIEARQPQQARTLGFVIACPQLQQPLEAVQQERTRLTDITRHVAVLLEKNPPTDEEVSAVIQQVERIRETLRQVDLEKADRACRQREKMVLALAEQKREVLDSVRRSRLFALRAARTYSTGEPEGGTCAFTSDCRIPLTCAHGHCQGTVSLRQVRPILDRARTLVDTGMSIRLDADNALSGEVAQAVQGLVEQHKTIRSSVERSGWPKAVDRWSQRYAEELVQRLDSLGDEVTATIDSCQRQGNHASVAAATPCAANERLAGLAEDIAQVKQALGDVDPVSSPHWVMLKTRDIEQLERQLVEARQAMLKSPPPPVASSNIGPITWVALGALLVGLAVAASLLWRRRLRSMVPQ